MSNAVLKFMAGGTLAAGLAYGISQASQTVSANEQPAQRKMVRRHSSGDHAFLPDRQVTSAKKTASKGFGVQEGQLKDDQGSLLPSTRGY